MPDALFADPRLARLYDVFDGDRDDLAVCVGVVAEPGADRVLRHNRMASRLRQSGRREARCLSPWLDRWHGGRWRW